MTQGTRILKTWRKSKRRFQNLLIVNSSPIPISAGLIIYLNSYSNQPLIKVNSRAAANDATKSILPNSGPHYQQCIRIYKWGKFMNEARCWVLQSLASHKALFSFITRRWRNVSYATSNFQLLILQLRLQRIKVSIVWDLPTNTKNFTDKKAESETKIRIQIHWLLRSPLICYERELIVTLSCFHPSIHPPPFLVIKSPWFPSESLPLPCSGGNVAPEEEAPPKKGKGKGKKKIKGYHVTRTGQSESHSPKLRDWLAQGQSRPHMNQWDIMRLLLRLQK